MAALDVLSVAQAKEHLNIPADQAEHDAELTRFIEAVVPAVERRVGQKLYPRPVSERRTAVGGILVLSGAPVASLTSVAYAGGEVYPLDALRLDAEAGIVSTAAVSGSLSGVFDVDYQLGHSTVPPDIALAIAIIVGESWSRTQRRTYGARPASAQQELEIVARGLFPSAALQLLPEPAPVGA